MCILESLKNLNISEGCLTDILSIVEELISEDRYVDTKTGKYTPEVETSARNMMQKLKPEARHLRKEAKRAEHDLNVAKKDVTDAKREQKQARTELNHVLKSGASTQDIDDAIDNETSSDIYRDYSERDYDNKLSRINYVNADKFIQNGKVRRLRNLAVKAHNQNS